MIQTCMKKSSRQSPQFERRRTCNRNRVTKSWQNLRKLPSPLPIGVGESASTTSGSDPLQSEDPKSIRISALCRTLHSPLHSWLISILLSRNRLRSLPGEAHVRNFYFCKFLTVLVVSYLFSFFISIFCFSDFHKIIPPRFRQNFGKN